MEPTVSHHDRCSKRLEEFDDMLDRLKEHLRYECRKRSLLEERIGQLEAEILRVEALAAPLRPTEEEPEQAVA